MAEQLINDFATTLAAPLAAAGTSISVTTGVPTAAVGTRGRVRIGAVDSAAEIVLVTFTTATSWTVVTRAVEDSTRFPAADWAAGTPVEAVLTAAGVAEAVGVTVTATGNTLWVDTLGSDSTGTPERQDKPYLTLAGAKAAASSGDIISARPGSYTTTGTIAANGVNWFFDAGASIAGTGGGIFTDGGSALSFVVDGFVNASLTGAGKVVEASNAASDIVVRCGDLSATTSSSVSKTVSCTAGRLAVEADTITGNRTSLGQSQAVWWNNGSMYVRARRIQQSAVGGVAAAVWGQCNATPTGEMNVQADEIYGTRAVYNDGTDTTAAMWVRALTIQGTGSGGVSVYIAGSNRVYVEAQKLFGRVLVLGGVSAASLAYVNSVKISATENGTSGAPALFSALGASTVNLLWDVEEADPAGFTGDMFIIDSGTHEIRGMRYTANSGSKGINVTGGTVRLVDCVIDTSANTSDNPLTISGGTVILQNCTLKAASGRNAITAGSAQTVRIEGDLTIDSSAGGLGPHANVTVVGVPVWSGPLTVYSTAVGDVPVLVRAFSGQTGDLIQWQDSTGTVKGSVLAGGGIRASGSYTETTSTAGFYAGIVSSTPRCLFANGNNAQNWQIDNNAGSFRWFLPGTVHMTLDTSGLTLGNSLSAGAGGGISASGAITTTTNATSKAGLLVQSDFSGSSTVATIRADKFSSTSTRRQVYALDTQWADSTDGTRKGRVVHSVYDTAARETIREEASGSAAMLGFFGATAVIRPATTGTTTGFTAGAGTGVKDDSTFTGGTGATAYRISDIVLALKQLGLLTA